MITRLQVIFHARQWIATPYVHMGRTRGKAADCLFYLCVCEQLGIFDKLGVPVRAGDYPDYPRIPVDSFIRLEAARRFIQKPASELMPGDFVVTRYGATVPSHSAIVAEFRTPQYRTLTLIHCDGKQIVEHSLSSAWRRRIVAAFSFPDVQ